MSAWLGTWRLLPELSHYSQGKPPQQGEYQITRQGEDINFAVRWTKHGATQGVRFGGPAAGRRRGDPPLSVMAEDSQTLITEAYGEGDERIALAIRRVSDDGQKMSILQQSQTPTGPLSIFQVYERIDERQG